MEANKVFGGQGAKAQEGDKLNIDSIIARLLEGKTAKLTAMGSKFKDRKRKRALNILTKMLQRP